MQRTVAAFLISQSRTSAGLELKFIDRLPNHFQTLRTVLLRLWFTMDANNAVSGKGKRMSDESFTEVDLTASNASSQGGKQKGKRVTAGCLFCHKWCASYFWRDAHARS